MLEKSEATVRGIGGIRQPVERLVTERDIDFHCHRYGHLEVAYKPSHFEHLKKEQEYSVSYSIKPAEANRSDTTEIKNITKIYMDKLSPDKHIMQSKFFIKISNHQQR